MSIKKQQILKYIHQYLTYFQLVFHIETIFFVDYT